MKVEEAARSALNPNLPASVALPTARLVRQIADKVPVKVPVRVPAKVLEVALARGREKDPAKVVLAMASEEIAKP
jgi:hypothetical protein